MYLSYKKINLFALEYHYIDPTVLICFTIVHHLKKN